MRLWVKKQQKNTYRQIYHSVQPQLVIDHLPCLVWFLSGKILLCKLMAGKEYSKGDSRYAGRDSAIVAVEGITSVLEGPPCLLAV